MDWSRLPADILNSVATKLPDPDDIIRMRAVCKGWESATPTSSGAAIYRLSPWIMDSEIQKILDIEFLQFYSPSSKKVHRFRLPVELRGMDPVSSDGGFVLFCDIRSIRGNRAALLNPLTGKRIDLPPLDFETTLFFLLLPDFIWQSNNAVIACTTFLYSELQLYMPKNLAWSRISTIHWPHQVVHHNGKLYFTDIQDDRSVTVFDIENLREEFTIALPPVDNNNLKYCQLVASASHGLLLVTQQEDDPTPVLTSSLEVFQLNCTCYPPEWVKITSLANHALLIGMKNGLSLEISSNNLAGLQRDCIYELNWLSIHKFSLRTGQKQEELSHPFGRADWFVPNPRF